MCFLIKDMVAILLLFNANLEDLCLTRLSHTFFALSDFSAAMDRPLPDWQAAMQMSPCRKGGPYSHILCASTARGVITVLEIGTDATE